jgi:hypothetical protein
MCKDDFSELKLVPKPCGYQSGNLLGCGVPKCRRGYPFDAREALRTGPEETGRT